MNQGGGGGQWEQEPGGGCLWVGERSISYLALSPIAESLFKVTVTRLQDSEAEMVFAHWLTV